MIEGLPAKFHQMVSREANADKVEAAEIEWVRARGDEVVHPLRMPVRTDFSDRFLAKLSLGLGANLFGAEYVNTAYATALRKMLWPQLPIEAPDKTVRGTGFWYDGWSPGLSDIVSWPGGWLITLIALPEGFGLRICTPGGRGMTIVLSDEKGLWASSSYRPYDFGQIYIAIPQRQIFAGPIPLVHLMAHKNGSRTDPTLRALDQLRTDSAKLPKV